MNIKIHFSILPLADLPSRVVVTCLVSRPQSDSEPNAPHQTGSWAIQGNFS